MDDFGLLHVRHMINKEDGKKPKSRRCQGQEQQVVEAARGEKASINGRGNTSTQPQERLQDACTPQQSDGTNPGVGLLYDLTPAPDLESLAFHRPLACELSVTGSCYLSAGHHGKKL